MRRVLFPMAALAVAVASVAPSSAGASTPATEGIRAAAGSHVRSDFNGDGFADLAVGVPRKDPGGLTDSGAVSVMYGGPHGLRAKGNQEWTEAKTIGAGKAAAGDLFGYAVTAGDFNGDGRSDLAVGIPYRNVDPYSKAGAVLVLYGSRNGLRIANHQFITTKSLNDADSLNAFPPSGNEEYFGSALTAGDFNGDGRADLAIGAPNKSALYQHSGVVSIVDGGASGLVQANVVSFTPGPDDNVPGYGGTGNEAFGSALAAGNFGKSSQADLAVGAETAKATSTSNAAGDVVVLYGSSSGVNATGASLLYQVHGATLDEFGAALAAGDVGKSRLADLAVGIPQRDLAGKMNAGAVETFYGGGGGLTNKGHVWTQSGPAVIGDPGIADNFGAALAIADFGRSSIGDLAIGVSQDKVGKEQYAGAVNVLYGTAKGLTASHSQIWTKNRSGMLGDARQGQRFGAALYGVNFGRSGRADLAIGAPAPFTSPGQAQIGTVSVIYGSKAGLRVLGNQVWNQNSNGIEGTTEAGDQYGASLG